jgi:periplasmic divalent cation tolerance protein
MSEFIVILSTISSKDEAGKIAKELVQKKLAACVNIIEGLTSVYEWDNEICIENECLMIIKSRKELFDELKKEIISLHLYEVPEIISLPVTDGLESYLNWISKNTK